VPKTTATVGEKQSSFMFNSEIIMLIITAPHVMTLTFCHVRHRSRDHWTRNVWSVPRHATANVVGRVTVRKKSRWFIRQFLLWFSGFVGRLCAGTTPSDRRSAVLWPFSSDKQLVSDIPGDPAVWRKSRGNLVRVKRPCVTPPMVNAVLVIKHAGGTTLVGR